MLPRNDPNRIHVAFDDRCLVIDAADVLRKRNVNSAWL